MFNVTRIIRRINQAIGKNSARNTGKAREIGYNKLKELVRTNNNIQIVDIRSPQEFEENRIRYAINIPLYDLEKYAENVLQNKNQLIVVYCQFGARSKMAYQILTSKGYTNVYSLKGGIESIM